jgi:hypothetical protein
MTSNEAYKTAQQMSQSIMPDDYRFDRTVRVVTRDGTSLFYPEAFVEKCEEWWFVFTKNFGFIVLSSTDLLNEKVSEYIEI